MWKRFSMMTSIVAILLAGVTVAWAQNSPTEPAQQGKTGQQQATAPNPTNGEQNAQSKQQPNEQQNNQNNSQAQQREHAFLGVGYAAVPKALASQLSAAFPKIEQGAMIEHVLPNSPAAKAGIRPFDIVTEINKKPVRSENELMRMVERDKPGQELSLQVVRASKAKTLTVKLGEWPNMIVRGQEPENARGSAAEQTAGNNPQAVGHVAEELESFDSLSLERTGKDQFKADIRFRDKQGKIDSRTFQGSRQQIQKDITSQTDLPRSERHQLLGSLRLPMELGFGNGANSASKNDSQENSTQKQLRNAPESNPGK